MANSTDYGESKRQPPALSNNLSAAAVVVTAAATTTACVRGGLLKLRDTGRGAMVAAEALLHCLIMVSFHFI